MRILWVILLWIVPECTPTDVSGGLGELEISPTLFTHVQYKTLQLPIWQHRKNSERNPEHRQYFTLPLGTIDPSTATCIHSVLREGIILQVSVLMRANEADSAIVAKLRSLTKNRALAVEQLSIIPMERFRFVWKTNLLSISDQYLLDDSWQSYGLKSDSVRFAIHADSLKSCEILRDNIIQQPTLLDNLELQFILRAKKTRQAKIIIKGRNLANSSMLVEIRGQIGAGNTAILRKGDVTELSNEVVTELIAKRETDAEYVDRGDSLSLAKLLTKALTADPIPMGDLDLNSWKSVYWKPATARPDKVVTILNKVFRKSTDTTGNVELDPNGYRELQSALPNLPGIGTKPGLPSLSLTERQLREWLDEAGIPCVWNGSKFVIKMTTLYKINLNRITSRQHIVSTDVQVYSNEHVYSLKPVIPTPKRDHNQTTAPSISVINHRINKLDKRLTGEVMQRLNEYDDQLARLLSNTNGIMAKMSNPPRGVRESDLIAQAVCGTLSGAWIWALRRNCSSANTLDCHTWCRQQPFMGSGGKKDLEKRKCIGSMHVHISKNYSAKSFIVQKGSDVSAYQIYNYRSCLEQRCGPNYCCCSSV